MQITNLGLWLLVAIIVILVFLLYRLEQKLNLLESKHNTLVKVVTANTKALEYILDIFDAAQKELDEENK